MWLYITRLFFIISSFILTTCFILCAKDNIAISSEYPMAVYGKNHAQINEILYFCNNYVSYLRDKWLFKKENPTTLKIFIKNNYNDANLIKSNTLNSLYINTNNPENDIDTAKKLTVFIISDYLISKYPSPKIPLFISEAITGIYLKRKIDPYFISIHKKIVSNEFIPLRLLISIDKNLSPDINDIFILESIYFIEYIASFENGKETLKSFIEDFQADGQRAIDNLAESLKFKSEEDLEEAFLKTISSKKVVYNIASSDVKISVGKIPFIVDEILIFRYPDPFNKENVIETHAYDITSDNLKYIGKSCIEEKIMSLEMLLSAKTNIDKINKYITAFKYLKKGDINNYYNNLNTAKKLRF